MIMLLLNFYLDILQKKLYMYNIHPIYINLKYLNLYFPKLYRYYTQCIFYRLTLSKD